MSSKEAVFDKHFSNLFQHPLFAAVRKLIDCSEFALRRIHLLEQLLQHDNGLAPLFKDNYQQEIKQIDLDLSEPVFGAHLRVLRNKFFLRLAVRELGEVATTEETMASWSDCADVLILHVLDFCERQLCKRYGKAQWH